MAKIKRRCLFCLGNMKPTKKLLNHDKSVRMFKCEICNAELPWLRNPAMDGCYAEKHKFKDGKGGFCLTSLISDPDCDVYPLRWKRKIRGSYTDRDRSHDKVIPLKRRGAKKLKRRKPIEKKESQSGIKGFLKRRDK